MWIEHKRPLVPAASAPKRDGSGSFVLHGGDRQHHLQAQQLVWAPPPAASDINTMRVEEDQGSCHKIAKRILLHSTQAGVGVGWGQFWGIHKTTHYHKIRACCVTICDLWPPSPPVGYGLTHTGHVLFFLVFSPSFLHSLIHSNIHSFCVSDCLPPSLHLSLPLLLLSLDTFQGASLEMRNSVTEPRTLSHTGLPWAHSLSP